MQWIYRAAYGEFIEIAKTKREMTRSLGEEVKDESKDDTPLWIHVGNDLAYNVGESASCGATTILLDLDKEYR